MAKYSVDTTSVKVAEDKLLSYNGIKVDESRLEHCENLINSWINCQPHFPKNVDKQVLHNFIRNCKYNLERIKKRLERYFLVKNVYPQIFSNRSPDAEDVTRGINALIAVPLPKLTENGYRVMVFKVNDTDPSNFDPHDVGKVVVMLCDLILTLHHPVAGDIVILDGSDIGANHFIKVLVMTRLLNSILKEAYPIRVRQMHIINVPSIVDKIVTIIKPLLSPKIRDGFVVHSNSKSLLNYVNENALPSDYGGKCKSLDEFMKDWKETLKLNVDWFVEQESVKMIGMPKKMEECYSMEYGLDGSFRKLEID